MSWHTPFKILYSCAAFSGVLMYGSYYFVQLRGTCSHTPLPECVFNGQRSPTELMSTLESSKKTATKPPKSTSKTGLPEKEAKADDPAKTPPPSGASGVRWGQTSGSELLLIWNGLLDGEVGRIAPGDFDKAVRAYQATLPAGVATEEQQLAALRKLVDGLRSRWGFDREDDPSAVELSLPHKLVPNRQELGHGSRYQSSTGDFSIDVAEWTTSETTLERARQNHCCKPPREPEGPIVGTSDAVGPGFILNAREGRLRVSVWAQQRDTVIRILAITYDMGRDKEYRVLRNVIASSYAAFAPARKREERVYNSCQRSDGERCGAEKPPAQPGQWDNGHAPL
jgi:hypothetical protein